MLTVPALVSPEKLRELLGSVTVLDVRWRLGGPPGEEEHLRGHVPGAPYVDLETELADPPGPGGRHPLPSPERFEAAMRRHGVRADRPVVVYDDVSGTSAARCWWLLRYFGHRQVSLLDGGWTWWLRSGGPVEEGPVRRVGRAPGDFTAVPGGMPVLDADGAARMAAEGTLVDARAPERYRGEVEPVDPVAGHIPGAVNVPTAANLVDARAGCAGRFKMRGDLGVAYAMAGVRADRPIGVYCGSGVTAAHDVFALSLLGVEAALYPGSWSEWVSDDTRPVARSASDRT